MSLRSVYISQVAACFDPLPEIPRKLEYFYQADYRNMDRWKTRAQDCCMHTVSDYSDHHKNHTNENDSENGSSVHSSPSGYEMSDRPFKKRRDHLCHIHRISLIHLYQP